MQLAVKNKHSQTNKILTWYRMKKLLRQETLDWT